MLDSTINPDMMEMYADENSRGGVLEPSGAVEIKYKHRDLIKTMHRLDDRIKELNAELAKLEAKDQAPIKAKIAAREKELLPFYQMMSLKFADLHDTPGRMKEKGVINEVIPWQSARRFFYHRLRRRLVEERLCTRITKASPGITHEDALSHVREWLADAKVTAKDDSAIASSLEDALKEGGWAHAKVSELRAKWMVAEMMRLRGEDEGAFKLALSLLQGK